MTRRLFRLTPVLALLAAALAAAAGCDRQENTFVAPPPPPVTVARPVEQPVTDYIYLTGNTQAVDQVQLEARVEGFLAGIHFKDGEIVKKGALLFTIEPDVYKAKVQQAEGQLAAAQAQLLRAGQEYDRQLALLKQNATAKSEVERWKAERDAAEASIVEARAGLELARINLGYTRVTAPFDGRMDRHLVTPGNLVGAGRPTALATITRIDPIYVYFSMNERDLLRLVGCLGQAGHLQGHPARLRRPRGRGGVPQRRAARFRLHGARPGHGHHPAARRVSPTPGARPAYPPWFRGCSCGCASPPTSATRRFSSPSVRWASTRAAATCSRSTTRTSSSSAR